MADAQEYTPPEGYEVVLGIDGEPEKVVHHYVVKDLQGELWVDVKGKGTLVKHYPVLDKDDLVGIINLGKSLAYRFFRDAESGINVSGNLEERKEAYEAEEDPVKKRSKATIYFGAMFNEVVVLLEKKIREDAAGVEREAEEAEERKGRIESCFMESLMLVGQIQLRLDGTRDYDGILGKEFGEASKLLSALAIDNEGRDLSGLLKIVYSGRYTEVALAKEEIAVVGDAMLGILEERDETRYAMTANAPGIGSPREVIESFVASSKSLVELMRDDLPAYDEAKVEFDDSMNNLRVACQQGQRLGPNITTALKHILKGRSEINNMVTFRMGRPNTVNGYLAIVEIGRAAMYVRKLFERSDVPESVGYLDAIVEYSNDAKQMVLERYRDLRGHHYSDDDPEFRPVIKENYERSAQKIRELISELPGHLKVGGSITGGLADFFEKVEDYIDSVHEEIRDSLKVSTGVTINVAKIRERRERIVSGAEDLSREFQELSDRGRGSGFRGK